MNMENQDDRIRIGRYLYELRIRHGYTLQAAADQMHIHKSTLCRYELGSIRRLSPQVKDSLQRVYGISEEELTELRMPDASREGKEPEGGGRVREEELMDEEEFLRRYRALDARQRRRIQFLLLNSRPSVAGKCE